MPKTLYLVGTPIGNMGDMTHRAIETLKTVDIIAAEDTRRAKKLLDYFQIAPKRLLAHHQGNEHKSAGGLVKLLQEGNSIAYVTDSGMPTVSDPGFLLAREAIANGISVVPIAGVSALTTALAGAGLPTAHFTFIGFPPRKQGQQEKLFTRFINTPEALVMYESPKRIAKTLETATKILGNRQACVGRELTKMHEEFTRQPLQELVKTFANKQEIKGEITLIISGK